MRISDWSSDVCSSDLAVRIREPAAAIADGADEIGVAEAADGARPVLFPPGPQVATGKARSEEHTSELQSLMRISYAVFCLKKNTKISRLILSGALYPLILPISTALYIHPSLLTN